MINSLGCSSCDAYVIFENQAGSGALSLQIPNDNPEIVLLSKLIQSDEFLSMKALLPIILGVKPDGSPLILALEKLPHLVIAGTTGAGKSCLLQSLLIGMLLKNRNMSLILVDPKQVEFNFLEDVPNLISDLITSKDQAIHIFQWLVNEMQRRYLALSKKNARTIVEYNLRNQDKIEPIVVIVDEYADILSQDPSIDKNLTILAQKSRAAGIHLVLATQRPSSDVITPHIKANISCRIGLKVASKSNSRVIIDENGAERLLGNGDALVLMPNGRTVRFHGAFCDDNDLDVFLNDISRSEIKQRIDFENDCKTTKSDTLVDQAIKYISESNKKLISTSDIQGVLKVGHAKATSVRDDLHRRDILGERERSNRGRAVLI